MGMYEDSLDMYPEYPKTMGFSIISSLILEHQYLVATGGVYKVAVNEFLKSQLRHQEQSISPDEEFIPRLYVLLLCTHVHHSSLTCFFATTALTIVLWSGSILLSRC